MRRRPSTSAAATGPSTGVQRPVPKGFFDMTFDEQEAWARDLLQGLSASVRQANRTPPPTPAGVLERLRSRLRRSRRV